MNSRKRKGQLESMIGKIFVLSLFLILLVNLIVPNKEKSEEEKIKEEQEKANIRLFNNYKNVHNDQDGIHYAKAFACRRMNPIS